jgi:hypothetical protein
VLTARTVGLLVGRETSFPQAVIAEINRRGVDDIRADYCRLAGTRVDAPRAYAVIVDRISHLVPYYRSALKYATLTGTVVINNPFWWSADEKFFGAALATRLGVATPRCVVLPNKAYPEPVSPATLRNLTYPLPWEDLVAYVGFPALLKPNRGGGLQHVYKVRSLEELWRCYDQTGLRTMILQEHVEGEYNLRCLCIGRRHVLPLTRDPEHHGAARYVPADALVPTDVLARVEQDTRLLCDAAGYDLNAVEFVVRGGVPYAVDVLNPAPDVDRARLSATAFQWVVDKVADLAIAYARGAHQPPGRWRWDRFLRGAGPDG